MSLTTPPSVMLFWNDTMIMKQPVIPDILKSANWLQLNSSGLVSPLTYIEGCAVCQQNKFNTHPTISVTEIPFVDQSTKWELLSLLGDWYEPESIESLFSSMPSNAVFFSS